MSSELRLFEDYEGTKPVKILEFDRKYVGTINKKTYFLKNIDNDWPIDNITLNNSETELDFEYPKKLEPMEVKVVEVIWKPGIDRRKPLNTKHLFVGELLIG